MKFLIVFALSALVACINANPWGNSGYNSGYGEGRLAYLDGGYGNNGGYGRPLISRSSNPSAAAAASAASAGIRPGRYDQVGVIGYELDAGYNGRSGYGRGGYGRGGY